MPHRRTRKQSATRHPSVSARPVQQVPLSGPGLMALHDPALPAALRAGLIGEAQRSTGNRVVGRTLAGPLQRKGGKKKKSAATTRIEPLQEQTWPLDAETLADAVAVVQGRDEAGSVEWFPNLSYELRDGKVSKATVTVQLVRTMPDWPGAANLNKRDKAEWRRFYQALLDHEQGHVDLARRHLQGVASKLIGLEEADAQAKFAEIVAALQQASDEYDTRTDHGRKTGTIIQLAEEE